MAERKPKIIKKQKAYVVIGGCDTSDGHRYEIGDTFHPEAHPPETTKAFIEMNCIEETDGDS